MEPSCRTQPRPAKCDSAEFEVHLEDICRVRLSEVMQAILEAAVDEALERPRYERGSDGSKVGYRDGHDRQRTTS